MIVLIDKSTVNHPVHEIIQTFKRSVSASMALSQNLSNKIESDSLHGQKAKHDATVRNAKIITAFIDVGRKDLDFALFGSRQKTLSLLNVADYGTKQRTIKFCRVMYLKVSHLKSHLRIRNGVRTIEAVFSKSFNVIVNSQCVFF